MLTVIVIVAAWAMLRQLPTTSAQPSTVAAPRPGEPREVRSVSLDGDRLPQARLRAVLETHPGERLRPEGLVRDRAAMERELADEGYLAARVDPAEVAFDAAGAAYVTFEIELGALFHLRSVEVTGPGKGVEVVTLAAGDDARRARIEATRLALGEALSRRRRSAAVELSVHTDLAAAAVDVVFATR